MTPAVGAARILRGLGADLVLCHPLALTDYPRHLAYFRSSHPALVPGEALC